MKRILVLIFPFFLLGCTANYTLTIDNNSYQEDINIKYSDLEEKKLFFSNEWTVPIDYDEYSTGDDFSAYVVDENKEYYKYIKKDDGLNFRYNFNINSISNSTALKKCFDSARVISNNDKIIITTSNECNCFNDGLKNLIVNIIINDKEVISENADRVIGNKYIWEINENNYNNKSINIVFQNKISNISKSEPQSSYPMRNLLSNYYIDNNLIIFCLIFLVIGGIGILVYTRIKKDDM